MSNFSKPTGPLLGLLYFFIVYVIVVVLFTLLILLTDIPFPYHYGANKTVGLAYDACSFVHFIALVSLGTFVLVYLLMMIFRIKIYRIFSILNFIITIAGTLYLFFKKEESNCLFFIGINILSILFSSIYFLILSILKAVGVIRNRR